MKNILTALIITIAAASMATSTAHSKGQGPDNAGDLSFAVNFKGFAVGDDLSPGIQAEVDATGVDLTDFVCYQAPLLDLESRRERGIGVDCLRIYAGDDELGAGARAEAKTFFFLGGNLVVTNGCTSIRPFSDDIGDAGVTHMTGSIPPSEFGAAPGDGLGCGAVGGVIYADAGFKGLSGDARISGAVDLSDPNGINFNCLIVVTLSRDQNN